MMTTLALVMTLMALSTNAMYVQHGSDYCTTTVRADIASAKLACLQVDDSLQVPSVACAPNTTAGLDTTSSHSYHTLIIHMTRMITSI